MSTTNPEHGRPPADPVGGLAPIPPGSPRADDHGLSGPPSAETIARGHEADAYDKTSVMSVPLLVVLFFVLAFGTVSIVFYFIFPSPKDETVHPMAKDRFKKSPAERFDEMPDPKLDNFESLEGASQSISRPKKPSDRSQWIQPDALRVNQTNTPALYKTEWTSPGKTHARITIDDAMQLAVQGKHLPVSKTHSGPAFSANRSTAANAGRPVPDAADKHEEKKEGKH